MPVTRFKSFVAAARKPNYIDFGLMPAGADLSWIAGYSFKLEPAYETPDGVRTEFSFPYIPVAVLLNGVALREGVGYTLTGNATVTMSYAPGATDDIREIYQ